MATLQELIQKNWYEQVLDEMLLLRLERFIVLASCSSSAVRFSYRFQLSRHVIE